MSEPTDLTGIVLDEHLRLSLDEVCRLSGVEEQVVVELVREGVVDVAGSDRWVFTGTAVTRVRTALRLQRDLEVNLPGAALALELMDEIERLRRRRR